MGTIEFLDRVRQAHSISSDYALAKRLDLTPQQISKYRSKKDHMGDETAARVAELLALDPGFVVATIHAERARTEAGRALWQGIAARLERAGVAAAAFVVLLGFSGTPDGGAMAAERDTLQAFKSPVCILCKIKSTTKAPPNLKSPTGQPGHAKSSRTSTIGVELGDVVW